MALSALVTSLTSPVATGSQSYTGFGFAPKALIVWECAALSDGTFDHAFYGHAVAIGTAAIDQMALSLSQDDANTSTNVASWQSRGRTFDQIAIGAGPLNVGTLTSLDADGITVDWTTVAATSRVYNLLALGGDDWKLGFTGTFTVPSVTGAFAVTGVGFQADVIFFATSRPQTAGDGQSGGQRGYFGVATGTNNQNVYAYACGDAQATDNSRMFQLTNRVIAHPSNANQSLQSEAALNTIDADGFTLNFVTLGLGSTMTCYYSAMSGGRWAVGNFNQSTTTGNQSVTGVGFQPRATVLRSFNSLSSTGSSSSLKVSIGGATATNAEACNWAGANWGATITQCNSDEDRTKIIKMITPESTPTVDASADFSSHDSDGFSIDWATNDGTAREILYFVCGDTVAEAAAANDTESYVFASF